MSNDKITESTREPYDAMGPVDAPNPPAARATLADVQPGGRVRLGDQAERARFEAWGRTEGLPLARGKLGGYAFEVTAKAWLAWQYLSAQPSPGGQDARAQFEEYRGGDCERDAQGYYVHGRTAQDWALWQAALAARQPVGEPVGVATVVHSKHFDKTQCTFMRSDVPEGTKLYAAPPAQAVDLGQFREAVECWVRSISIIADNEQEDAEERRAARDLIRRGEWLLALIDSKAVGNG